jgi:hypothetical protein
MIETRDTYQAWQDGYATPLEALRALCMDLGEVESELDPLTAQRETLRNQISEVLARIDGEKAEVKGFGTLRLTQASITKGYDKAKIQALINELVEDYPEIAARLVACETQTMRSGGLRIEREKAAR